MGKPRTKHENSLTHSEGQKLFEELKTIKIDPTKCKHSKGHKLIKGPLPDNPKIDADTSLEVLTYDDMLALISPVSDNKRHEEFIKALDSVNKRYGNALKRLAE